MSKETYEKFLSRFNQERFEIMKELEKSTMNISNLKEMLKNAMEFTRKLPLIWTKSDISEKEKLQKLLFPDGLAYDKEKGVFRTDNPNFINAAIARLSGDLSLMKKGLIHFLLGKSLSAETERFELSLPFGKHAFQACSFGHSDKSPCFKKNKSSKSYTILEEKTLSFLTSY